MTEGIIKWGILGLGKIAHKFAHDLNLCEHNILHAVGSRSIKKAELFKQEFEANTFYGSYDALINDPYVDIIYVATPHAFHFEHALKCLQHGKSVLCEKPMGMNTKQVEKLCDEAKQRGLFLMEALWTRFIPATIKLLSLLKEDVIGEVHFLQADFGFKMDFNPSHRLFDPDLGGGALLDIGIYPIYMSQLVLGQPTKIQAMARFTPTKVDSSCFMQFDFTNQSKAQLHTTIENETPTEAIIYGSKGTIKLHSRFHHTQKISIQTDSLYETLDIPYKGFGYVHEILEVQRCLQARLTQSPLFPWDESILLVRSMDQVRECINLRYEWD